MLTAILVLLLAISVVVGGALYFGASRWRRKTEELHAKLLAARHSNAPATYDPRELEGLPPPVRRYFLAVLQAGQPIVSGVQLSQVGQIRQGAGERAWRPFTAHQMFTPRPAGFDWDARIRMAPGVTAFVHDAYAVGEGMLHAEVWGLFRVADLRGTPAAAQGELLRYLAEAVWFPTALLPSQGVVWEAIDDSTARATLTDGATSVALEFGFDSAGLIVSCKAVARFHSEIDGVPGFAPWHGRFWAYESRDGLRIPLEGEVAWQLPAGLFPYCRVLVREIHYEFAR